MNQRSRGSRTKALILMKRSASLTDWDDWETYVEEEDSLKRRMTKRMCRTKGLQSQSEKLCWYRICPQEPSLTKLWTIMHSRDQVPYGIPEAIGSDNQTWYKSYWTSVFRRRLQYMAWLSTPSFPNAAYPKLFHLGIPRKFNPPPELIEFWYKGQVSWIQSFNSNWQNTNWMWNLTWFSAGPVKR
jgi:hypothetical protein